MIPPYVFMGDFMSEFRPIGEYVLVEMLETEESSGGLIVLPKTRIEKNIQRRVVSVGTKVKEDLVPGDLVSIPQYLGRAISKHDLSRNFVHIEEIMVRHRGDEIQPLGERVIVEVFQDPNETTGGILLPENRINPPTKGRVIAVGTGKTLDDGTVRPIEGIEVGDGLCYPAHTYTKIKVDGRDCGILYLKECLSTYTISEES
jgi:chaperonin GroES